MISFLCKREVDGTEAQSGSDVKKETFPLFKFVTHTSRKMTGY